MILQQRIEACSMSVGGEAFTAANSAVFPYTVKSGDMLSTTQDQRHFTSHTAS